MNDIQETAILAAGCFWCIEPIFQQINGVDKVISGYTGGDIKDPSYELVGTLKLSKYGLIKTK